MRYRITHITEYRYGETVPLCHNIVHLRPRVTKLQRCLLHSVAITPDPTTRRDRRDFFGNDLTWFSLQEPHKRLRIVARSEVDVQPFEPPTGFWLSSWNDAVRWLADRSGNVTTDAAEMLDARQFTFSSPFVPTTLELADYASPSFTHGRPLLDAVTELTHRIHDEFVFDPKATTVGTPVMEVLRLRRGVCQDFAHLQVGCLRSLGLAARYVSGYLVTRPPPGKPRLVGSDVSHAWVSCFFPGFGWIDFDPTNGLLPTSQHITLGWARDYDDVGPVRGVVVGGRGHSLAVSVDVEPIDESPANLATPELSPT